MTNNPTNSASLGSSYSTVGFINDRTGVQAYIRDANAILQIQQRVTAAQQGQVQANIRVTQATQTATTAQVADARAKQRLVQLEQQLEVTRADAAGKIDIYRRRLAQLNEGTEEYIRTAIKLQQVENARARANIPLPRTFAGVTSTGASQLAGAFGVATGIAAVATLTQKVVQLGNESANVAIQAQTIGRAFETATSRAGVSSDELLTTLRSASRGTVAEVDLQLSANKALALGVGEDVAQIGDLLAIARQKGKDFGLTTEQAFSDIVTGLGRASPLILDNLGIVLDLNTTYGDYAKSIHKTVEQLTEQDRVQALVNDVIRTNSGLIQANADAQIDAGDRIAAAEARRKNAQVRTGAALAGPKASFEEAKAGLVEGFVGITLDQAETQNRLIAAQATSYEDYIERVRAAQQDIQGQNFFLQPGNQELGQARFSEEEFNLSKAIDEQAEAHKRNATAAQGNFAALEVLDAEQNRVTHSTTAYTAAIQDQIQHTQQYQANLGLLALQQGRLAGEADGRAAAARQQATARLANERELQDTVIATIEQTKRAEEQKVERLDTLEEQHTEKVADLQQRIVDTNQKAQDQIVDATADGAERRAALEQDLAERVSDFISSHAQDNARQMEDQRISDERSARDFAQSQQDATTQYNEGRADAETAYEENRQRIIDQYNQSEERLEEEHQRELTRTQREAQLSQYQSTASFLERLYGLTRGRRNKAALEEAKAAFAAAREEAAQLAGIDPAAAAQLLAERQRQILAGIERKREEAQLRRDARRGGGITTGDINAEIADINTVTAEADQATIDAIKAGAQERAEDRKRQGQERQEARDDSLSDLDKRYRDEQERAAAAFADQRQQAQAARDQQLADQDADRRRTEQRRQDDYAAQLADLRQANTEQLAEFDANQEKRLQQIRTQAAEQVAATQAQLRDVNTEYVKARQKVSDDYDVFITDLNDKLRTAANTLDLLPDEQRRRQLTESFGLLGTQMGAAFSAALQGALNQPGGVVPGGTIRNGTTADDPRPQGGTIARLFGVGATTGDTFDAARPGTTGTHQGLDVQMRPGSKLLSPVAGTITKAGQGSQDFQGGVVMLLDDLGREWYFGHVHNIRVRVGQTVQRGTWLADIGVEAHTHVQLRARPGDTQVIDPSAALDAAAGAATAPAGTFGAQSYGARSDISALPLDRPRLPLPVSGGGVDNSRVVTIDFSYANFGPGTSPSMIEGIVRPIVNDALLRAEQAEMVEINRLRNSGPWRAS